MPLRTRIVLGLGNPGSRFERSRHNAGFAVIDRLARRWHVTVDPPQHRALLGTRRDADQTVILVKPLTFMNVAGDVVRSLGQEHELSAADFILVHDDVDVSAGRVKLRMGGGAGGHHGVESVVAALGSTDLLRVKVGVGRPPNTIAMLDWVLGEPSAADAARLLTTYETAADAVELVLDEGPVRAMNRINEREAVHGGSPL